MRRLSTPKQLLRSNKFTTIKNPEILREYDKAIHIEYNKQRAWLTLSEIQIDYGDPLRIRIPRWLFKKKFCLNVPNWKGRSLDHLEFCDHSTLSQRTPANMTPVESLRGSRWAGDEARLLQAGNPICKRRLPHPDESVDDSTHRGFAMTPHHFPSNYPFLQHQR